MLRINRDRYRIPIHLIVLSLLRSAVGCIVLCSAKIVHVTQICSEFWTCGTLLMVGKVYLASCPRGSNTANRCNTWSQTPGGPNTSGAVTSYDQQFRSSADDGCCNPGLPGSEIFTCARHPS
ncbi:hypothetical protein BS47DRAFT_651500 [Hydnum rufescens UP504]|uniref:Uncharacterized protein n=1 Tax=Hydnum rufescens UP504 TaxID=1448309 RepID=A0A9P6E2A5_9AGAM|nr:hypothetical protein BS47DRAFT_651500 [Hydnum rufescens UP504]